jgi:hypothetical protein
LKENMAVDAVGTLAAPVFELVPSTAAWVGPPVTQGKREWLEARAREIVVGHQCTEQLKIILIRNPMDDMRLGRFIPCDARGTGAEVFKQQALEQSAHVNSIIRETVCGIRVKNVRCGRRDNE